MCGFTLRALPVCFVVCAVGCFSTGGLWSSAPAKPTPTHAYWQKVGAVLAQKPASNDMPGMMHLVRTQTDQLRELAPEGVDAELVAAVDEVIKCEERVIELAEMAGNNLEVLRGSPQMPALFADANRKAVDAKKKLKALRGPLNTRHGGGFAPIG